MISDLSPPPVVRIERGESAVARQLGEMFVTWLTDQERTGRSVLEISAIHEAIRSASLPNWDGYGAAPVPASVRSAALHFHHILPTNLPPADVGVDPDGELSFEWRLAPDNVLSISIGEGGTISYAGLHGSQKYHGTERISDTVSDGLLEQLRRFFLDAPRANAR